MLKEYNWNINIKKELENIILANKNKEKLVLFDFDNTLVQKDLGLKFKSKEECLIENAYSLIEKGWLPDKTKKVK